MKILALALFAVVLAVSFFWWSRTPAKAASSRSIPAQYDTAFGGKDTLPGTVFVFPDLKVTFLNRRDLTLEEARRKKEAIAAGMDGGASMLSPFNAFQVDPPGQKIELSVLPYARKELRTGQHSFVLKNTRAGEWLLERSRRAQ